MSEHLYANYSNQIQITLSNEEISLAHIKWKDTEVVYRIKKYGIQTHKDMFNGGHLCPRWCTHLLAITLLLSASLCSRHY